MTILSAHNGVPMPQIPLLAASKTATTRLQVNVSCWLRKEGDAPQRTLVLDLPVWRQVPLHVKVLCWVRPLSTRLQPQSIVRVVSVAVHVQALPPPNGVLEKASLSHLPLLVSVDLAEVQMNRRPVHHLLVCSSAKDFNALLLVLPVGANIPEETTRHVLPQAGGLYVHVFTRCEVHRRAVVSPWLAVYVEAQAVLLTPSKTIISQLKG
mmetsp:Transcript_24669/g.57279  ORF Transcript_24669/g.57279 Transcript_24669/m.57279 type:complete len:209 (-) Transcript_24669:88-714(-)